MELFISKRSNQELELKLRIFMEADNANIEGIKQNAI